MTRESFSATAWHNGSPRKSGSGYGLKVSVAARDRFFDRQWQTVTLRLHGENANRTTDVNCAKDSFWNGTCRELIGRGIGIWFIDNGLAPWSRGNPPRFRVSPLEPGVFAVAPERL